ncbi:hypothetical protein D6827_01975 [Candidatus Parcubacteria bacterium]|nr:MAG: hypothetical protein D6827_01975 [Candidatus Parcubacteria bacterium]
MEKLKFNIDLDKTANFLASESQEICEMNGCSPDEHLCESYAYFLLKDNTILQLIDICYPDYFQGVSSEYDVIVLPLPFEGNGKDLKEALEIEWNSMVS